MSEGIVMSRSSVVTVACQSSNLEICINLYILTKIILNIVKLIGSI